jgi:hypothetical protein
VLTQLLLDDDHIPVVRASDDLQHLVAARQFSSKHFQLHLQRQVLGQHSIVKVRLNALQRVYRLGGAVFLERC